MSGVRRPRHAFVLLEVLVSLAILGFALATTLRSFTASLKAARLSKNTTIATMLARRLIEQWEIVSPGKRSVEGTFAPEAPDFSFAAGFRPEPIRYEERIRGTKLGRMVGLRRVSLTIYYTPPPPARPQRLRLLHVESAFSDAEKFNPAGRMFNEIGFED